MCAWADGSVQLSAFSMMHTHLYVHYVSLYVLCFPLSFVIIHAILQVVYTGSVEDL